MQGYIDNHISNDKHINIFKYIVPMMVLLDNIYWLHVLIHVSMICFVLNDIDNSSDDGDWFGLLYIFRMF